MVTARISALSGGGTTSRAGVVIRESTAANARYYASMMSVDKRHYLGTRTNTGGSSAATATTQIAKPHWVRMQRVGDLFTASTSPDGTTWTTLGTPQTLALPTETLVGLSVSARSDGLLSTATFDNVSLTPAPVSGLALQKRSIGFVNASGEYAEAAGTHTLSGSGAGVGGGGDECDFSAMPVSGDFTLVARVTSQTTAALNAQAGVMVRESQHMNGRMLYCGTTANGGSEFIFRIRPLTHAAGVGLDHTLVNGMLTFDVGEQTKDISFNVINDAINEEAEMLNIALRNPNAALLGTTNTTFTYTIEDDDSAPALGFVGFASATGSALEASGTANVLVSLSLPATSTTAVDFTVADGTATGGGTDYTLASGTVSFAAGETIKSIPIVLNDDAAVEPGETLTLTLQNPVACQLGSLSVHTFTITDDDRPVVSISATDSAAIESGDTGTFTVSRTGPTTSDLTVTYAVTGTAIGGTDYTSLGTSVVIPIGASSAVLTVSPIQDAGNEGPETVIVTLSASSNYTIGSPNAATVNLADDDRSTVTITANDPTASETSGNPGQFTVTRTAPTTGTLTVNITRTGTATNTTDYATIAATVSFAANEVSKTINVTPVDDTITEGPELVTLQLTAGTYLIGGSGYDDVTIEDNDSPPTIFISGPTAQGPLIADGNGIILTATAQDDGAPAAMTYLWTCVNGAGTATIETTTAATTPVSFSAPGTYVMRCTVSDTQFTVSDQVTVVVGASIAGAEWVNHDLGPTTARRGQALIKGGIFTLLGTGGGYAATATDTAHIAVRQADGDSSVTSRLVSQADATTPFSGVTMRETLLRGSKRVALGCLTGTGLQMRTRGTASTNDVVTATVAGITPPVWLKLERNATTGDIVGSYAPDVSGTPGTWTTVGTAPALYTTTRAALGLTTTSNSTTATATGTFDNVTLTPAVSGPALIAEENSTTPNLPGTFSESGGTYTIAGSPTGVFYGWQFYGDLMVTAKHANATSGAGSATSGIVIREAEDGGARVQMGRIPTGSYNGYFWTSIAGGANGGVPSFTGATRWVRLIRKGNTITAFHAADSGGAPGTWAQLGQSQTVIMPVPVLVGFSVNNASGVGYNTVTLSNLSIVPLNKAPVVGIASVATYPLSPIPLDGTVTDDSFPTPISLTTQWSQRSGPGTLSFGNTALVDTTAAVTAGGTYTARLQADDTSAISFRDLTFNAYLNPLQIWQAQNWSPSLADPAAAESLDPDFDGQVNLLEYAFGTEPAVSTGSPVTYSNTVVSNQTYLRMSVPKNPAATDVVFTAEATSDISNPLSWSSAGLIIETNTSTQLIVRDSVPAGPGTQRFMRVRVERP
jgi:regulation of enolase protein 1 (concanavalin A-like superfamily)